MTDNDLHLPHFARVAIFGGEPGSECGRLTLWDQPSTLGLKIVQGCVLST